VPAERPAACLNCGSAAVREFCPECGQRNVELRAPWWTLAREALEDTFSFDSRLGRTVGPFLARPGHLTAEWCAGRRTRYSSPLRLYLLASAAFFLVAALVPERGGVALRVGDLEVTAGGVEGGAGEANREEVHRGLREMGAAGRVLDRRLAEMERQGLPEAGRRVAAAYRDWVPRVTFFLVPVLALLLELLWRRRWLTEHLVLSLHAHAVAFVLFAAAAVAGRRATGLAAAALLAWLALAVRRVYGDPWGRVALKLPVLALLYGVALGLGLAAVAVAAFLTA
jgi:hypothetical protein